MNGCRLSIIFLRLWYILGGAGRPGDAAAEIAMRAGAVALWRYEAIRPRSWRPRHADHRPRGRTARPGAREPGLRGASSITRTLYAGLQLILPGEVAPSHRHTQSALRFVSEGRALTPRSTASAHRCTPATIGTAPRRYSDSEPIQRASEWPFLFTAGPTVRIHFPPAGSLRTSVPVATSKKLAGAHSWPSNCRRPQLPARRQRDSVKGESVKHPGAGGRCA
jgi:hypothetical protein